MCKQMIHKLNAPCWFGLFIFGSMHDIFEKINRLLAINEILLKVQFRGKNEKGVDNLYKIGYNDSITN